MKSLWIIGHVLRNNFNKCHSDEQINKILAFFSPQILKLLFVFRVLRLYPPAQN